MQAAHSHIESMPPWQSNGTLTLPPFQTKYRIRYPHDDGSQAYSLASRAHDAAHVGDEMKCNALADRAIEASNDASAWKMKTWALCLKSLSLTSIGLHADAMEQGLLALRLAEAHDDHTLISRASCAIGFVAIEAGNLLAARDILDRSLNHAEISGSLSDLFWALSKLCDVYGVQAARLIKRDGATDQSSVIIDRLFETATRALQVAKKLDLASPHCRALLSLVNACILDQQVQKAQSMLDECKAIAKSQGDLRLLGLANLDAARILELEGATSDAITLIRDPAHLDDLCKTDDLKLKSQELLARLYSALGDFEQAFHHMSAARDIERKMNATRTERHTRNLVASMEMREARVNAESFRIEARTLEMRNSLLQQERDILRRHAMLDALTGVGNRRAANAAFKVQVAQGMNADAGFLVAYLDIDHFKPVNDQFGHRIGDTVLRQLGQILRDNLRSNDQVFRYGGEEFVLIMANEFVSSGLKTCESLRHKIASHPWCDIADGLAITASFGVAKWMDEPCESAMMARADRALYQAKARGRNCVVLGTEQLKPPLRSCAKATAVLR